MVLATIFIVEDDTALAAQAMELLQRSSYKAIRVQVEEAMNLDAWRLYSVTSNDLVVLDLNFKMAGVPYSGKDVLRVLERGKKQGILPGLEKILVATSMKGEVEPKQVSPEIAFIDERIAMYGLEKGVNQVTRLVDSQGYGRSLLAAIEEIYRGERKILNTEF